MQAHKGTRESKSESGGGKKLKIIESKGENSNIATATVPTLVQASLQYEHVRGKIPPRNQADPNRSMSLPAKQKGAKQNKAKQGKPNQTKTRQTKPKQGNQTKHKTEHTFQTPAKRKRSCSAYHPRN